MEIRTLRAAEREALLELLDGWELRDGWRGRDFFRRHVEIDPTYRDENVWVAVEDEELCSCVQIFSRRVRVLGHAVPVGGIGSVFTRADRRRGGLAGAVLERAAESMIRSGMELSILFGDQLIYRRQGWRSFRCERGVLRKKNAPPGANAPSGAEIAPFDRERDFEAVRAIHAAYSAPRSGTLLRDASSWEASFRLSGNPSQELQVARREGRPVAYLRATRLEEIFTITELGRLDDAADALAELLLHELDPRTEDSLASPGERSEALRAFALLPAFDDATLARAIESQGGETSPLHDSKAMLRCLDAEALARRLGVALLPGEAADAFLRRILPEGQLVFWPADRL